MFLQATPSHILRLRGAGIEMQARSLSVVDSDDTPVGSSDAAAGLFILQCLMKNMKIEKVWNGSDIHYVRKMARAGQKDRNIIDCVFFGFFVISGD